MFSNVHQKQLYFNNKKTILVANDGGTLTNDAGIVLVAEFLKKIDFDKLLKNRVHIEDKRQSPEHQWSEVIKQWLFQLIAGYSKDRDANTIQYDEVFKQALEQESLSSQSTFSNLLKTLTAENIEQLSQTAKDLGDLWMTHEVTENIILDVDSTACFTYGKQEKAQYISHYGAKGLHPFVCFDGLTGLALDMRNRRGQAYTSTGSKDYLEKMIDHYSEMTSAPYMMVRGDSGFATPEIYDLCEEKDIKYVIKLKINKRLTTMAEEHVLYCGKDSDFTKTESQYFNMVYQAASWKKPRTVAVKATRPASEFFFNDFQFIVTNYENFSAKLIFQIYQKRGNMENFIKEMKSGFFASKTDSHTFVENSARLALSFIAYNIMHLMKNLTFPEKEKKTVIDTIRFRLFHIAGKITKHARQINIHLSSANVYDQLFWNVLANIQRLNI